MKTSSRIFVSASAFALVSGLALGSFAVADAFTPTPVKTVLPAPSAEAIEPPIPADEAVTEAERVGSDLVAAQAKAEADLAQSVLDRMTAEAEAGDCVALQASFDRAEVNGNTGAMVYADSLMANAGCYDAPVETFDDGAPVVGGDEAETPAPAPAPPAADPEPSRPSGDQQAGECREYNEANECTAVYVP